uniref:Vesicle-associated membrane protein 7 n=1 Tax=Plectus sambesii TaxID=2011161 RepID=A0A914VU18_9BILA
MPLLFSSISRGTAVLAKHATCPGNFIEVTEQVLTKITENGRLTYSHGLFLLHYIADNGIVYLCITDDEFERSRAFAYLAEIKRRFEMIYGARVMTALPYAMNSDFAPVLAAEMRGFSMASLSAGQERSETLPGSFGMSGGGGYGAIGDAGRNGRMLAIQKQTEGLKQVMVKNIDALTARGEKLELLIDRSENLEAGSMSFRTRSRNLERHMLWKNIKITVLLIAVLLVVIFIIVTSACGGLSYSKC